MIGHLRVRILCPAETLFQDIASLHGAPPEGPCTAADEALVGGDDGSVARAVGNLKLKRSLRQGLNGGEHHRIRGFNVVIHLLGSIDGSLIGCFVASR